MMTTFDFAILSEFNLRNVIIWHLTIITASKMLSKRLGCAFHYFMIDISLCSVHILTDFKPELKLIK